MKKIVLGFVMVLFTLFNSAVWAQVSIGKLEPPDPSAVLQVVSQDSTKGVLIPYLTTEQRDKIVNPANGLMIYNVTDNCFNYYDADQIVWASLCGSQPPAKLTVDCGSITVKGVYTQGVPCGSSQYLEVPITVNTPGNFTIIGTTKNNNGYSFTYSGTAAQQGTLLINVPAQGTPASVQTDTLVVKINNVSLPNCDNDTIHVNSPAATYTITSCGQSHFGGSYRAGVAMTPANTDTVSVNVTNISSGQNSWAISTNTVNGISFSGSGLFTTTGPQKVVLYATGTPAVTQSQLLFTYTTNSLDPTQQSAVCQSSLKMTLNAMTVLYTAGYEAIGAGTSPSYTFANPALFGPLASAAQPVQSLTMKQTSDGTFATDLAAKPDIVFTSYASLSFTQAEIDALLNYVKSGGVLVLSGMETNTGEAIFFSQLYGTTVTQATVSNSNNFCYAFQNASYAGDPIMDGSFGTFGAAGSDAKYNYWGEDAAGTQYLTGLPATETIYTNSQNVGGSTLVAGSATMFKSNQYNIFYIGDGGWSNPGTYSATAVYNNPFRTTGSGTNYFPAAQLYGYLTPQMTNNAALGCNIMAWAINQAQFSGINKYK